MKEVFLKNMSIKYTFLLANFVSPQYFLNLHPMYFYAIFSRFCAIIPFSVQSVISVYVLPSHFLACINRGYIFLLEFL